MKPLSTDRFIQQAYFVETPESAAELLPLVKLKIEHIIKVNFLTARTHNFDLVETESIVRKYQTKLEDLQELEDRFTQLIAQKLV